MQGTLVARVGLSLVIATLVPSLPRASQNAPSDRPIIGSMSVGSARMEGGEEVLVTGRNFTPDALLTLGDAVVTEFVVEDSEHLLFVVPPQRMTGVRAVTLRTAAGYDQVPFRIVPPPLSGLAAGEITTIAGGIPSVGDGIYLSNSGSGARLTPMRITVDASRNLYAADTANHRVRRVEWSEGKITTYAGTGVPAYDADGVPAVISGLNAPQGVALDAAGNLFIADTGNHRIRRVDAVTGMMTTVVGTGETGFSGDGGPATQASLSAPTDVAIAANGDLFVADSENQRVRRVDGATGVITTYVGGATELPPDEIGDGRPATEAILSRPVGVALGPDGDLFIADWAQRRVRRVDAATSIIHTVAGGGATFSCRSPPSKRSS